MYKYWKEPLKKTIEYLTLSNIPYSEWTFGGGTALMLYYHHRVSKDIDIFLNNAQYLTFLSPRLNESSLIIFGENDYNEQSNFLKIEIKNGGFIDFILAPHLTQKPERLYGFIKEKIQIETPCEIITKKIFYRSESFKTRDIFDLGVVITHREKELCENLSIFHKKLPVLLDRINEHKKRYFIEVEQLELTGKYDPEKCFENVKKFILKNLY